MEISDSHDIEQSCRRSGWRGIGSHTRIIGPLRVIRILWNHVGGVWGGTKGQFGSPYDWIVVASIVPFGRTAGDFVSHDTPGGLRRLTTNDMIVVLHITLVES